MSPSGIHNVNSKEISATIMPLPSLTQQLGLVETLDNLLGNEQTTAATASSSLDTIRAMRQSLLAKALRGELCTNDPNDPDAEASLIHMFAKDTA